MNTEIKEKWVKALRSGKYQQTVGALKDSKGGFCCLGVLCDVLGTEWRPAGDWKLPYKDNNLLARLGEAFLSNQTLENVGLTDAKQHDLACMNDAHESFNTIADHIEAFL